MKGMDKLMQERAREELERRAVELFEARRKELGLTVDAVARRLYPGAPIASARMNINRLRLPQATGKPKRLVYGDFIALCLALDLEPERVLAETVKAMTASRKEPLMREDSIIALERAALDFLLAARKEAGMSEKELGSAAFPDADNPRAKVHSLWSTKTASNKGLRLRLGDFCAMCQALGKSPAEELARLWDKNPHE